MRKVRVHFENFPGSPYSQSAKHGTPMKDREAWDDYDERTYLAHCTTNQQGQICVPAMAFKQCLDTSAFKLGLKIPGRRGATFKSFFASGFFCDEDVPLFNGKAITPKDANKVPINANSNGKRGSGSRVTRRFPSWDKYHGVVSFTITDPILTPEVFETHFKAAGIVVGIGRFRPENGGNNGRFRATKFEWQDFDV